MTHNSPGGWAGGYPPPSQPPAPGVAPAQQAPAQQWPAQQAPAQPQGTPPYPAAPLPKRRRGRKILGAVVAMLAAGVVVKALSGSPVERGDDGVIDEPGQIAAYDLRTGDCFNNVALPADGKAKAIHSVDAVPCTSAHSGEVIARLSYGPSDSWTDVTGTRKDVDCGKAFQDKLDPKILKDKAYELGYIYPDAVTWVRVKAIVCVVQSSSDPMTGSVRQ